MVSRNDLAVSVRGLSKSYTIAHNGSQHVTLAETLLARARSPFTRSPKETFWALTDLDFDIKKGDVVGIIGRNGAGKSTLLKILSRITEPTDGQINLYGRVGSLLEVGTGFHPELTGRENIFLNGAILGMAKAEIKKQFDAIVDFAGVEKFLDTPVKRYSSGMYVRLAFAVAAHLNPEILIIDEVLAVGDAEFQKKCMGKMGEVARNGRTVLFVSHNITAVRQLCTRSALLRRGQLVSFGETDAVLGEYFTDASVSEGGRYDLSNHPARLARYTSIIKAVTISSDNFLEGRKLNTDRALICELEVDAPFRIREPRFACAVEDSYGRRIMTIANYLSQQPLDELQGKHRVTCTLNPVGLGAGRYMISVSVAEKTGGLLDSVDHAGWFEVGWDNNYGNGEPYNPVYGPIVRHSHWSQQRVDVTGPRNGEAAALLGEREAI